MGLSLISIISMFYHLILAIYMKASRKWAYIALIGSLTTSAVWACYWQTSRYLQAVKRWDTIRRQLKSQNPDHLNDISTQQSLYPFKYLSVEGTLSNQYQRVDRAKNGRMGYLIVRGLKYRTPDGKTNQITALQGWCSADFQYSSPPSSQKTFKGILREKQKRDFVHENFTRQQLARYKLNTYINLQETMQKLGMTPSTFNSQYYIELLRPLDSVDQANFPYQYSVDNFELPYLTPDKHLSYASFWACTSVIGMATILRVLRFK